MYKVKAKIQQIFSEHLLCAKLWKYKNVEDWVLTVNQER